MAPSARMVKLVDTWDLKSLARKGMRVRIPLRVPANTSSYAMVPANAPKMVCHHGTPVTHSHSARHNTLQKLTDYRHNIANIF